MQPRTLRMKNFGPYLDETVEFGAFLDQGLFLVSGKTGAGKTTIFDGMTFALFGQTSGKLRSGKEMRSLFAQPTEETEVTFSFSHGGLLYEVMRRPEQEVAKKRGTGTTKRAGKTTLTIYDELGNEKKQYTKNVDYELYQLLHLTADQFFKIIMLPQGEFRNFLVASSTDKEQVLRRLFDTEIYQNLQTWLKEQAAAKNQSIAEKQTQAAALVDSFKWFKTAAVFSTLTETLTAWQGDLEELVKEVADQTEVVANLTAKKNTAEKQYYQAEELKRSFDELKKVLEEESKLALEKTVITQKKDEQNWLLWLQQHLPLINSVKLAASKVNLQADKLAIAKKESQKNAEALEIWQEQRKTVAAWTSQLEAAQKSLHNLEVKLPQAQLLEQQRQILATKKIASEKTQAELTILNQAIATLQLSLSQQEQLTKKSSQWQKTMTALTKIQQTVRDYEKLIETKTSQNKELQLTKNTMTKLQVTIRNLQAELKDAEENYRLQKSNYAKAMIARLSLDLVSGEACPVCGATEHPMVAQHDLTLKTVTESEALLNAAEEKRADLAEALARNYTKQEQLTQEADKFQKLILKTQAEMTDLKEQITRDFTLLQTIGEKEDVFTAITRFFAQQEQLGNEIQKASETQAEIAVKLAEKNEERQTLTSRYQKEVNQLERLKGEVESLQGQVGKSDAPVLRHQIEVFTTEIKKLNAQLQKDQTTGENLKAAAKSYYAQIKELSDYHHEAQLEVEKLDAQLTTSLASSPRELSKKQLLEQLVDEKKLHEVSEAIKTYENKLLLIKEQKQKLQEHLKEQEMPQIAQMAVSYENAQVQLRESQQRLLLLKEQQKDNEQLVAKLKTLLASHEKSLAKLAEIEQLSQVLSGKNTYKTSLERYVLQAYLAEILTLANVRLEQLTNGRYQFSLAEKSDGGRGQKGLDIDIYDDNAGQVRRVQTLSGGESFIAALALALSLADVIQNKTGGIALDALFIDEGFGSLDEEALEMALEALSTLETQGRLIGIISHVPALKEKIVRQINVKTNGAGQSKIAVKLA